MFFGRKAETVHKSYDPEIEKPVIRCSICNGEQMAGFVELKGGSFREVAFIASRSDLESFMREYGLKEEPEKVY